MSAESRICAGPRAKVTAVTSHRSSLALACFLVAGCPSADPDPEPTPDPTAADPCADSMNEGSVRVLGNGFTGGTEGIAFSPDGRLFVSRGDVLDEVFPDGSHEEFAAIPAQVGLTWWNGELIVASGDSGEADGLGGVYAVNIETGDVRLLAGGIAGANFPVVTPWDTLLVSTPGGDEEIVQVTSDGELSLWTDAVPTPNGIGFSADGSAAYIVSTYGNPAPLWEVPVTDGLAGAPTALVSWGQAVAPDGVAMGASGDVYIAQNIASRIDRVDPTAPPEPDDAVLAGGINFAASAAFGVGEDWDRCALYVTSLFSDELFVVGAGEPGL